MMRRPSACSPDPRATRRVRRLRSRHVGAVLLAAAAAVTMSSCSSPPAATGSTTPYQVDQLTSVVHFPICDVTLTPLGRDELPKVSVQAAFRVGRLPGRDTTARAQAYLSSFDQDLPSGAALHRNAVWTFVWHDVAAPITSSAGSGSPVTARAHTVLRVVDAQTGAELGQSAC
jgi:hypothetical protein